MIRPLVCVSVVLALFGCAGNPNRPGASAGIDPSQLVESDSIRGSDFARLFAPGDTLRSLNVPGGLGVPKLPYALQGRDTQASILFAIIVDSAGRIEAASRTVVASVGDPRVIKAWCDHLTTIQVEWRDGSRRRAMAFLPIRFFIALAPAGREPQVPGQKGFEPQPLIAMLSTMALSQRQQWFADQQPCASFPTR